MDKCAILDNHELFREFVLFKDIRVVDCLLMGFFQVFSPTFHFNEYGTFPKQIYITIFFIQFLNPMFKGRNSFIVNAKHIKKSTKNGFAPASSFEVAPHSLENFNALSLISFQLNTIVSFKPIIILSLQRYGFFAKSGRLT